MSGYLLDLFVQRERVQAMKTMVKSWVVFVLLYWGFGDLFICLTLRKNFRSTVFAKYVQCRGVIDHFCRWQLLSIR